MINRLFSIITFAAILFSCKKGSEDLIVEGAFTIKIKTVHHNLDIPNCSVFLKRNATQWPGTDTTIYDLRTVTDGAANATISKLFPGNYYLYAKGFDPVDSVDVIGYMPVILSATNPPPGNVYNGIMYVSE